MDISYKEYVKVFGIKIFLLKVLRRPFYDKNTNFAKKVSKINEQSIKKFLLRNVLLNNKYVIKENNLFKNSTVIKNNTIWIMWWQGYNDTTPKLVKKCIENIKKLNPKHKVIVLTKYNVKNYVHLNRNIISNFEKGNISITHLSDIIRVNLLYLYGGVWIDSTVFSVKSIPEEVFRKDFYTIKTGKYTNEPSHGRWTTFFMETSQGSLLMKFLVECFDHYFETDNIFLDYILFDYFINIGCDINSAIRKMIDDVPVNNPDVFKLRKHLLDPAGSFNLKNKKTYLYKLSYKDKLMQTSINGKKNVYSELFIKEK